MLPAEVACLDVARYGKNRFRLVRCEEIVDEPINPSVNLGCGGAGRQREVHSVNEAGIVHAGEAPERRFRLA